MARSATHRPAARAQREIETRSAPRPRGFPRATFKGATAAPGVAPPCLLPRAQHPRRPRWRRAAARPALPTVEHRALTRRSAPSDGRGRRSRPSWGPSCWAWRAPPAAVSAASRTLGTWLAAPAQGRVARRGGRRNAEGSAQRGTDGAGRANSAELGRRAGRGALWAGAELGRVDGQSTGRMVPVANESSSGPPPEPILGGPHGRGPMMRAQDGLPVGRSAATCGQWERARCGFARQRAATRIAQGLQGTSAQRF